MRGHGVVLSGEYTVVEQWVCAMFYVWGPFTANGGAQLHVRASTVFGGTASMLDPTCQTYAIGYSLSVGLASGA